MTSTSKYGGENYREPDFMELHKATALLGFVFRIYIRSIAVIGSLAKCTSPQTTHSKTRANMPDLARPTSNASLLCVQSIPKLPSTTASAGNIPQKFQRIRRTDISTNHEIRKRAQTVFSNIASEPAGRHVTRKCTGTYRRSRRARPSNIPAGRVVRGLNPRDLCLSRDGTSGGETTVS